MVLWKFLKPHKLLNASIVDSGAGESYQDPDVSDALLPEVPEDCAGFNDLPEHLLERIFAYLGYSNRKHHFTVCAISRTWRRIGQRMFFSRPWQVPHIICHPNQLFCLSPRLPMGSRSGLLKCFVQREPAGKGGGRKFKFFLGKDPHQPHRARFLLCALQLSRQKVEFYLNSSCQGEPCGSLTANSFASKYTLQLAETVTLIPEPIPTNDFDGSNSLPVVALPVHHIPIHPLSSHQSSQYANFTPSSSGIKRVVPSATTSDDQQQQQPPEEFSWGQEAINKITAPPGSVHGVDVGNGAPRVLAQVVYKARVKGLMQPRRMQVALPNPSLLLAKEALPVLSRVLSRQPSSIAGNSTTSASPMCESVGGGLKSAAGSRRVSLEKPSAVAAIEMPPLTVGGVDLLEEQDAIVGEPEINAADDATVAVAESNNNDHDDDDHVRSTGLFSCFSGRRPSKNKKASNKNLFGLNNTKAVVPIDEELQPVCLKNKAPHWNEGLRCWCLNFRGRVKLASVKNFQLVKSDDAREKVVLQFGKVDKDLYVLDFNPTVLTSMQALSIALSTFNPKLLL